MSNPHPDTSGLIPYQPGQSGNPSGRPKKLPSQLAREILNQINPDTGKPIAFDVAKKWVDDAIEGKSDARNTLLDRVEGKVIQTYAIDQKEIKITGSIDDLIKLREIAQTEKGNDVKDIDEL